MILVLKHGAHVQGLGQNVALTRLGPNSVIAVCPHVLSYNWFLDCSNPEHNEVTHLLVKQALADESQNWFNLKLSGGETLALTRPFLDFLALALSL